MSSFKPKSNLPQNDNADRKPFVAIIPEDGLQAVQVGLLVNLGQHAKLPKFAKDTAGKREKDEDGKDKIILPKEGSEEQKVSVYVDLLTQEHDYEGDIGVRNIRVPLHQVSRGMSEGVNLVTVAPRDADGNYIKGKPWLLAPASAWNKIAAVVKNEAGKFVKDVIFDANYKNPFLNDVSQLLGKPFMYNVEVKVEEKNENKYVNVKLKNAVPMMKGMAAPAALIKAISVGFDDTDLLEPNDELGGSCKLDLVRIADLRKIVLASDYQGTEMQKAIQQKFNEAELIEKAKEIQAKLMETDKELQEIYSILGSGSDEQPETPKEKPAAKTAPRSKAKPAPNFSDIDDDIPF
jgi:hypothetical protein